MTTGKRRPRKANDSSDPPGGLEEFLDLLGKALKKFPAAKAASARVAKRRKAEGETACSYPVVRSSRRTMGVYVGRDGRIEVRAPWGAPLERIRQYVEGQKAWAEATSRRMVEERDVAQEALGYPVVRTGRKSVSISVKNGQVRVLAPFETPLAQIERAVEKERDWIAARVSEQRERDPGFDFCRTFDLREGGSFPCGGVPTALRFGEDPEEDGGVWPAREAPRNRKDPRERVEAYLVREAQERFREEIEALAAEMPGKLRGWRLSGARSRWGCCTSEGVVRLSWRAVTLPPEAYRYIIVHELAHLTELNHSPRFWAIVERFDPDWRRHDAMVKTVSLRKMPV